VWGRGSHDRRKLWRVFSQLQFLTAAIQREDGGQTPQSKLSFPEDTATGLKLQARLTYLHATHLLYGRGVHHRVLGAHNLQARDSLYKMTVAQPVKTFIGLIQKPEFHYSIPRNHPLVPIRYYLNWVNIIPFYFPSNHLAHIYILVLVVGCFLQIFLLKLNINSCSYLLSPSPI
jgi:hypothetical protein